MGYDVCSSVEWLQLPHVCSQVVSAAGSHRKGSSLIPGSAEPEAVVFVNNVSYKRLKTGEVEGPNG